MRLGPIIEYAEVSSVEGENGSLILDEKPDSTYWREVVANLSRCNGVYIFYDSSSTPVYFGVATRQSIWKCANRSYNRVFSRTRSLLHVEHPDPQGSYQLSEIREIERRRMSLRDIAKYFSAYEVSTENIAGLEAFVVRALGGSLLNSKLVGNGEFGLISRGDDE